MNKEIDKIKEKIIPILSEYNVTRAGLFGSFARGEQGTKSDIDILIEIKNGTDLIELIRLRDKLQKKMKRKVDLVEYNSIKKGLKSNILNDEIIIL